MADIPNPVEPRPDAARRTPYVPVKEGHPRLNLVIVVLLLLAFLVFALIQAQRLQL